MELKNLQLAHEEDMAKKEEKHKEAIDRLERQIDALLSVRVTKV